eukprot:tig00001057_g6698.t1
MEASFVVHAPAVRLRSQAASSSRNSAACCRHAPANDISARRAVGPRRLAVEESRSFFAGRQFLRAAVAVRPRALNTTVRMAAETLPLTPENVEIVLDEVRPYLIADGGNVQLVEIDGRVVRLQLQGACGSCPSSTMTMKMGIERKMKERIPEVAEVVNVQEAGMELSTENVDKVLEGIRPFLSSEGSTIEVDKIEGSAVTLRMTGSGSLVMSLRMEIMRRVQEKIPSVTRVAFSDPDAK